MKKGREKKASLNCPVQACDCVLLQQGTPTMKGVFFFLCFSWYSS